MEKIRIFSPATVANVGCGFDVLGFCLDKVGDEMVVKKSQRKGIFITKIEGFELPYDVHENVAGVSALAMYAELDVEFGFEIEIYKQIKPGSGIGSSAASAVGSVFGMNYLLGNPFSKIELIKFAMKGEAVASNSEHADNIAPAVLGGFTLVKQSNPLEVIQLPSPDALHAVIVHPQIEIKTADSRAVLPKNIPLSDAISQWSNVGSLVHALHTSDYNLIGKSLKDVVIEPYRSKLIPKFNCFVVLFDHVL
jgi:homoserine kinase